MGMGGMQMARWLPHWRCMHAYGCVRACFDDGAAGASAGRFDEDADGGVTLHGHA